MFFLFLRVAAKHCNNSPRNRFNPGLYILCQRAWARREKLNFVPKRLIVTEKQHKSDVSYRAILKKKNAPKLASLYDVFTNTKDEHSKATVKVDRNVLQRLLIAYDAG